MAKKRLNKKLLLILSLVMIAVVVLGVILYFQYLWSHETQPLIDEAEILIEQAREREETLAAQVSDIADAAERNHQLRRLREDDKTGTAPLWEEAKITLQRAIQYAREERLKIGLLRRLEEICEETGDFQRMAATWHNTLQFNARDEYATRKLLEYNYERVKAGAPNQWHNLWQQVSDDADRYMAIKRDDPLGYAVKAHTLIHKVQTGILEEPREKPAAGDVEPVSAEGLLVRVFQLDENNILGHLLLGRLELLKSQISLDTDEQAAFKEQAEEYLREGIRKNPSDPQAYKNLFEAYLLPRASELYLEASLTSDTLADPNQDVQEELYEQARQAVRESIEELDVWTAQFPEEAEFFEFKGQLSELRIRNLAELDDTIGYYEQAWALDGTQSKLCLKLGELYQTRADYVASNQADLETAYGYLHLGLSLPEQNNPDEAAPRYPLLQNIRILSIQNLIDVGAALALLVEKDSEKEAFLAEPDDLFVELRETMGAEHWVTLAAEGTLLWSREKLGEAMKNLYRADEMLLAEGSLNPRLKRKLFYLLRETEYQTLAASYGLVSGVTPRVFTDFIETASEAFLTQELPQLLDLIGNYETFHGDNPPFPVRLQSIKAYIYIRQGELAKAREVLAGISEETLRVKKLRLRLLETAEEQVALLEEIIAEAPGEPELAPLLFEYYIVEGKEDRPAYARAQVLADAALQVDPENIEFIQMQERLKEPDPNNISTESQMAIALRARERLPDPYRRALELGYLHQEFAQQAMLDKQSEDEIVRYRQQALEYFQAARAEKEDIDVLRNILDAALALDDQETADEVLTTIKSQDRVLGYYYEGILLASREEWVNAINSMQRFIQERPISTMAHFMLANIYLQQNQPEAALVEARIAVNQNGDNLEANLLLAQLLHNTYQNNLNNLQITQIDEMIKPLIRLAQGIPNDPFTAQLLLTYYPLRIQYELNDLTSRAGMTVEAKTAAWQQIVAKYELVTGPAFRLFEMDPTQEGLLLRLVAVLDQYSYQVTSAEEQNRILQELEMVFQKGLAANPTSGVITARYAEFLRTIDRREEAVQILVDTIARNKGEDRRQAQMRLSRFYDQQGDRIKGREVLQELLTETPFNPNATVLLAQWSAEEGNFTEALRLYDELRQHGDTEALMAGHVNLYLQAGEIEQAEQLLQEMEQQYPNAAVRNKLRGRVALRKAEYTTAQAYADRALQENPNDVVALQLKTEAHFYNRQYDAALECLLQLRRLPAGAGSASPENIAQVYLAMGRPDEAIRELRAALESDAGNVRLRQQYVSGLQQTQRWGELERFYDEKLRLPIYADQYIWRLEAAQAAELRGDFEQQYNRSSLATAQYDKALALLQQGRQLIEEQGQSNIQVVLGMLRLMRKLGRHQEVIQMAEGNLRGVPVDGLLLAQEAVSLRQLQQPQDALMKYEQALKLSGEEVSLYDEILSYANQVGEVEEVLAWGENLTAENPNWTLGYLVLMKLYGNQGDYAQVIRVLSAARATAPENLITRIDDFLASAYIQNQQIDQAIETLRRLLEIEPDNSFNLNNLAYLLLDREESVDEAVALALKAYELDRNNPNIMDTYALALIRQNNFAQAETLVRQAIQALQRGGNPVSPDFYYHLGLALKGQKRIAPAEDELRRALEMLNQENLTAAEKLLKQDIEAALKDLK